MRIRQSVFTAFAVLGHWSEKASRAFLFLGVGILRRSDLTDLSRRSWSAYRPTDADVRSGLTAWEQTVFGGVVNPGDRLCVVGCGSGRLLLPFLESGHDVVGVEVSPEPVARARALVRPWGQSADVIESRIEDAVLPGAFDVVLFSDSCYGYIQSSAARIAVLRTLVAHLNPAGRIVLTYPRRHSDWTSPSARLATLIARLTRTDWRLERYDSVFRIDVPGESAAVILEHFFNPEEVEREAERAGLRVLAHGDPVALAYVVLGR